MLTDNQANALKGATGSVLADIKRTRWRPWRVKELTERHKRNLYQMIEAFREEK